jgi:ankyrin repeat protein
VLAASNGHVDCVSALLAAGAQIDAEASDGWTALGLAASKGHATCVSALLAAGAQADAKDRTGWTALMQAASAGHAACVRALLHAGAQVDAKSKGEADRSCPTTRKRPFDKLLEVDANDDNDWTALMLAASEGHAACVSALLDAGAQVDAKNNDGRTALMLAAHKGHTDCLTALLFAGAEVDAKDDDGSTAFTLASSGGHAACATLLLDAALGVLPSVVAPSADADGVTCCICMERPRNAVLVHAADKECAPAAVLYRRLAVVLVAVPVPDQQCAPPSQGAHLLLHGVRGEAAEYSTALPHVPPAHRRRDEGLQLTRQPPPARAHLSAGAGITCSANSPWRQVLPISSPAPHHSQPGLAEQDF